MGGSESKDELSSYESVKNMDSKIYGDVRFCKEKGTGREVIKMDRFCENKTVTG
jgi:hypothetical protein